jgi:hypothetical protein
MDILRRLIAKGDVDQLPLAERALKQYWEATPAQARLSGLRLLQEDILVQRNAVVGDQRNYADIVMIYIEKKMAD